MFSAWEEVKRLRLVNATHKKKKFRLADITARQCLAGAEEELGELNDAEYIDPELDQLYEFADLQCVLMDYAQRKGWTLEQIDAAMKLKLSLRFTE